MKIMPTKKHLIELTLQAFKTFKGVATTQQIYKQLCIIGKFPESIMDEMTYRNTGQIIPKIKNNLWNILTEMQKQQIIIAIGKIGRENIWQLKSEKMDLEKMEKSIPDNDESLRYDKKFVKEFLKTICNLKPKKFEKLTKLILDKCGYNDVKLVGKRGDNGFDLECTLLVENKLKLPEINILVQCKKYDIFKKSHVSPNAIRDFRGAMAGRTNYGIFITSANFTAKATEEAYRDIGNLPKISLIDGQILCSLLIDLQLGITVDNKIDEIFFKNL